MKDSNLKTRYIGQPMKWFEEVSSTMDLAMKCGLDGAAEGLVIGADRQTAGRGRFNRKWESPAGTGLYFSIVLRPYIDGKELFALTFLSAVAVCEVLRALGVNAAIKWPNDILVENKKICGILTQAEFKGSSLEFVVVGIGVNVNTAEKDMPAGGGSIFSVTGQMFDRENILAGILARVEFWYDCLKKEGSQPILKSWKGLCGTLGTYVKITDAQKTVEGQAVDVADNGALLVEQKDGNRIKVLTGNI
ncbi:MAG: biotin--[acetyl-CoA-carboxylase] ligase [Candidatus Omnitrophica bacterium]|nr:biotin--[acetyl-CoA-carboxylase] ligase [Candidatus Omnitrophota bacterium]